jgi:hypothetical protein
MYHWAAKRRIVQIKMKRPTLCEAAKAALDSEDIFKFCNNIIAVHHMGAFGGKGALWNFLKDVASDLNCKKQGYRFSNNSKCFVQAMKVYGGRRMCDLHTLNYMGPSISTTKRENRKGIRFIPGEHAKVFRAVANIYRDTMVGRSNSGHFGRGQNKS